MPSFYFKQTKKTRPSRSAPHNDTTPFSITFRELGVKLP